MNPYILLKYAMYQGNFTSPLVVLHDVENVCHTLHCCMIFPSNVFVGERCFNVKLSFFQNDLTLLLFLTAMLKFH